MDGFDGTCKDSLSAAELSELLVDYAQENERLEAENKQLRAENKRMKSDNKRLRSDSKRLEGVIEKWQHKYSLLERDALSICKALADKRWTVRAGSAYYRLMYPDDYSAEANEILVDLYDRLRAFVNDENEQ